MQQGLLLQLSCGISRNDWGKQGKDTLVYKIAQTFPTGEKLRDEGELPYAEVWMGTHPQLPSRVMGTGEPLLDVIEKNPCVDCNATGCNSPDGLGIMFKVLAIEKTLSIQAHPTSELAKMLHAKHGDIYPDANEKPEMIVALTECEALVGFRPASEIHDIVAHVTPLRNLLGEKHTDALLQATEKPKKSDVSRTEVENAVQSAFDSFLRVDQDTVEASYRDFLHFLDSIQGPALQNLPEAVQDALYIARREINEWPHDIGVFVILFMNLVKLSPWESLFIPVGDIHAYVSGEMMECMIPSANLLRAGFTHKVKDIDNLIPLLNFRPDEPVRIQPRSHNPAQSQAEGTCHVHYDEPAGRFAISRIVVDPQDPKINIGSVKGPSMLICMNGMGEIDADGNNQKLQFGSVFYIGCGATVSITNIGGDVLTCYGAHIPN
ncbi:Mannose-6-phosphate isomerase [Cladobotryum mycophilum]|uniref:Mannose-6-phosphate isomerase n=1 Tax=Cladobotryum mycophilum TaxID=491253 RepID=A0ABR0SDF7_9HYPO